MLVVWQRRFWNFNITKANFPIWLSDNQIHSHPDCSSVFYFLASIYELRWKLIKNSSENVTFPRRRSVEE